MVNDYLFSKKKKIESNKVSLTEGAGIHSQRKMRVLPGFDQQELVHHLERKYNRPANRQLHIRPDRDEMMLELEQGSNSIQ